MIFINPVKPEVNISEMLFSATFPEIPAIRGVSMKNGAHGEV